MTLDHVFQAALLAASLGLGAFCLILSRRLRPSQARILLASALASASDVPLSFAALD